MLTVDAKLKLKNTKQSEAIRELLCMTNGVPFQPATRRLGGSVNAVGVKEVRELLERFLSVKMSKQKKKLKTKRSLPYVSGLY